MKSQLRFNIILLLLLLPLLTSAQQTLSNTNLTGLWKGLLYNDTTQKNLYYEIAISEENGKLGGYSYTLFDIEGKKEMGVKKIKIKQEGNKLIIEDVELIANDYSEPPPKKVRMLSVLALQVRDSIMELTGNWSTNRTREYRPLTGTLKLQRVVDYQPMVLYKQLALLRLEEGLSFVKAAIPPPAIMAKKIPIAEPELPAPSTSRDVDVKQTTAKVVPAPNIPSVAAAIPPPMVTKPVEVTKMINSDTSAPTVTIAKSKVAAEPPKKAVAILSQPLKDTLKKNPATTVTVAPKQNNAEATTPRAVTSPAVKEVPPQNTRATPVVKTPPVVVKEVSATTVKKQAPPIVNTQPAVAPVANQAPPAITVKRNPEQNNSLPVVAPGTNIVAAAANVAERKMTTGQSVFFESDSLVLTLYDNGDVDGDTVSVLMNGQVIFARQGLSTRANSKTVYIDKSMTDTLSMIMYAENLGSIPPNTGLLIIMDGEKRYEVRFSADLKTNASILLRRKPTD